MNWEQLIAIARLLASPPERGETRGRPQQVRLRRAISSGYYAIFHALAASNADSLIGSSPASVRSPEWERTYRALEHRFARDRFSTATAMASFPESVRDFGSAFVVLQGQRHDADYNPRLTFQRWEVLQAVERAEGVINDFLDTELRTRRALATYVLFRPR